ncbi:putative carboxylesterase 12 [Citrus sinensis]|uniref:Carboxylesterase 12 n=1 Tax=Citrus sinensis TaxID=2711 RepID=A0ACB8IGV6_CITSI|nr:putative carboxylesterase 12 [Citrus sinensis]
MDSGDSEITHNFPPYFKVYKDGSVERYMVFQSVDAGIDPTTGVQSKDVMISPETGVKARIFLPKINVPDQKLPLLDDEVQALEKLSKSSHVSGFTMTAASSSSDPRASKFHRPMTPSPASDPKMLFHLNQLYPPPYHDFCNTISSQANAIVVSVEYGLFPDRPIPACYEGSWAALKWVASHVSGNGPDPWLNHHADLGRVFIGGDSAGGNIAHTLAFRVGSIGLSGVNLVRVTMVHPFFGGTEDDEMWLYMCANNDGPQDPRMKPPAEDLARLGCERVLIFVAERDYLCPAGKNYYEELKKRGWKGRVELVEHLDEKHVFYLRNPTCTNALELTNKFISFIKQNNGSLRSSIESKY